MSSAVRTRRTRAALPVALALAAAVALAGCSSSDSGDSAVPDGASLSIADLSAGDDEAQIRKTIALMAHAAADGDGATLEAVTCPALFTMLGVEPGPFDPAPGERRLAVIEDVMVRDDVAQATVTWTQIVTGPDGAETEEAVGPDVLLLERNETAEHWVLCEPVIDSPADEDPAGGEQPGGEPAP